MAHLSENASRLKIKKVVVRDYRQLPAPAKDAEIWLLTLPHGRRIDDCARSRDWYDGLRNLVAHLHGDSVVAILTSPEDACETWLAVKDRMRLQLWVAIRLARPIDSGPEFLPEHHAALLVLSRNPASLRHTKTRIAYSYCPACDKTTKDYGGKKHTYHEYGTLLSDVWRDIVWGPDRPPTDIAVRLADLFGLVPYRRLWQISLRDDPQLKPGPPRLVMVDSSAGRDHDKRPLVSAQLIQGDCLPILRGLEENSIDFCFADPPYNLAKKYDRWDDALDIVSYFRWCDDWLDELARVLKPGRTCAVLNIPQWAIRHFAHLQTMLRFQNWIAWEGLSLPVRRIMPAHYAILCFSKAEPRALPGLGQLPGKPLEQQALTALAEGYCLRTGCAQRRLREAIPDRAPLTDLWWDIHRLKHNSRRVDHPCQLPPALMRRLIALFTWPGEVVLDPFDGSGTTSLCAAQLGRSYLGIELSEDYHREAMRRHELLARAGDPFAKEDRVPRAKNSRVKRIGQIDYAVPKKTLQLDVKRIAQQLGRLPTRAEVQKMSRYPIEYYDQYFISWGEVCAAARTTGMTEERTPARGTGEMSQPGLFD
jgi:site-specific DNA-methyltransferase (adenine-specific)